MTGDRMINLAKTPANVDFQSKYYKPDSNAAVKSLGNKFEVTDSVEVAPTEDFEGIVPLTNNSLPSSPVAEETTSHRRKGDQRQNVSRESMWIGHDGKYFSATLICAGQQVRGSVDGSWGGV